MAPSVLNATHPVFTDHWHPVYQAALLSELPVGVELLGQHVVLWRCGTTISAAIDRCPHRGARLSRGWLTDGHLTCPYHAWQYGNDGRACVIPQLEDGVPTPPKAQLQIVNARERYGLVWLCLGNPTKDIPAFPEGEDERYRLEFEFLEVWEASAPRIIDNSLDIAHTAVVHRNSIGDFSKPRIADYDVSWTEDGLTVRVPVEAQGVEAQGADSDNTLRDVIVEIVAPFCFVGRIRYANGIEHVIFTVATPISDTRSIFIQVVARNDTEADLPAKEFLTLDRQVTEEDRDILEYTDPVFPLARTAEVHLRCDRVTLAYREYLSKVVEEFEAAS